MANPYPSSPNSKFSPSSLEPFDLTHVLHNPSEPLDVLFALSALLPIFLIVAYVTMIISRREIAICVALVGQLMNEAGNAVVKRWFKQARPYPHIGTGHGMPSSHSQFMSFFATYFTLYCITRLDYAKPQVVKPILIGGVWTVAILVAYGRVYLSYHTPLQVLLGFFLGVLLALPFHFVVETVLRPYVYPWVLQLSVSKFFLLRDSAHVPIVFGQEFKWYEEAKKAGSGEEKKAGAADGTPARKTKKAE